MSRHVPGLFLQSNEQLTNKFFQYSPRVPHYEPRTDHISQHSECLCFFWPPPFVCGTTEICREKELQPHRYWETDCWTNPSLLVSSWHEWLKFFLDEHAPLKNAHRALLPPWTSPRTSNLVKRLNMIRLHPKPTLSYREKLLNSWKLRNKKSSAQMRTMHSTNPKILKRGRRRRSSSIWERWRVNSGWSPSFVMI